MAAEVVLPLLVLAPLAAGLAALALPAPHVRAACTGGVGLALLLALWTSRAAPGDGVRSLRDDLEGPTGPIAAALDRAGVEEPDGRATLALLLQEQLPPGSQRARARLEALAEVPTARAVLARARTEPPGPAQAPSVAEAEAALEGALAEAARLERAHAAVVREAAVLARAARGGWGERTVLVSSAPWAPALGVTCTMGVDGLAPPVAVGLCLLALAALLAAPDVGVARARRGSARATRGALVAVPLGLSALLLGLVALDLALLHAALLVAALPGLLVVASTGRRGHGLAERLLLVELGAAALGLVVCGALALRGADALGGEAVAALGSGGPPPVWDLVVLREVARTGLVGPGLQAALLLVLGGGAVARLALLGGWQTEVGGLLPPWLGAWRVGATAVACLWPLVRVAWPLAPDASAAPACAVGVAALGMALEVAGAALVFRAKDGAGLVRGASLVLAGALALGLAGGTTLGAAGAALALVVAGPALGGLHLTLARIGDRVPGASDLQALAGLGAAVPRLAGLLAVFLLAAAIFPGSAGAAVHGLVLFGLVTGHGGHLPYPAQGLAVVVGVGVTATLVLVVARLVAGPRPQVDEDVPDLASADANGLVPLAGVVVLLGLWPSFPLGLVGRGAAWVTGVDLSVPLPPLEPLEPPPAPSTRQAGDAGAGAGPSREPRPQ